MVKKSKININSQQNQQLYEQEQKKRFENQCSLFLNQKTQISKQNSQFSIRQKKINKKKQTENNFTTKYSLRNSKQNQETQRKSTEDTVDQIELKNQQIQAQPSYQKIENQSIRQNVKKLIQNSNDRELKQYERQVKQKINKNNSDIVQQTEQKQNYLKKFLEQKFQDLEKKLLKGLNDSRLRQKGRPRKDENYIKEAKKFINGEFEVQALEKDIVQSSQSNNLKDNKQKSDEDDMNTNMDDKPKKLIEEDIFKSNVVDRDDDDDIDQNRRIRLSLLNPCINSKLLQQVANEFQ